MDDKQFKKLVNYVKKDDVESFFGESGLEEILYKFVPFIIEYKAKKISNEICHRSYTVRHYKRKEFVYKFLFYIQDNYRKFTKDEISEIMDLIASYNFTGIDVYNIIYTLFVNRTIMGYPLIIVLKKLIVYVRGTANLDRAIRIICRESERTMGERS